MTESTDQAGALARQLSDILEMEFEAWRVQDLDKFEQLQPVKTELLTELTRLAPPPNKSKVCPSGRISAKPCSVAATRTGATPC